MTVRSGLVVLLLWVTLLAGCVPPPAAAPIATPPAAETATATAAPPAPTLSPSAAPTTPPAAPTPNPATMDVSVSDSTSPDGKWTATTTVATPKPDSGGEGTYYAQLRVTSADGKVQRTPVDGWSNYAPGYTVPRPVRWSANGQHLYYTNEPVPDGCVVFANGWDLWRLDLSDGAAEQITPGSGLWLSLSPDERTLATVAGGDRGLVLLDLATRQEQAIPLQVEPGDWQAGNIVWSPDSRSLALTVAHNPCRAGWAEATSIVRVDLAEPKARPLLQQDSRLLVTAEWPDPATIVLQDQDGQRFKMNAETGQVEPASDTGTLQGQVTVGPISPVVRADEPNPTVPPEVYAARRIVVYADDGQTEVIRLPIQPGGTYQVHLAPGSYVVDISQTGIDKARGLPAKVAITAGQTTTLDIDVDTGIR